MCSDVSLSGTTAGIGAVDFTVADCVSLSTHLIILKGNHKLKPCFIGPFVVVLKVDSQAY